jgi:zinc transporter
MADVQPGAPEMADKATPAQMATVTMHYRAPGDPAVVFDWTHLNGRDPATITWLAQQDQVPELVRQALVTMESRPRYEPIDDGVLLNLRAPALVPGEDQDALVSIRMWLTPHRAITVSLRDSEVMETVVDRFNAGRHRDPGDLVACFATLISERLDNQIAELGDALDDLELDMESAPLYLHRHKVSEIRSQSIEFRRFVLPQYHALERFSVAGPAGLA